MGTSPLPKFGRPPVVEVALGAYFPPLPLTAGHLGLLWDRWRTRYPRSEDQPGLPPVQAEVFGATQPVPVVLFGQPPVRVWYRSEGGELVQVQKDRVVHNWRKADQPEGAYPHYEQVRPQFERDLIDFESLVRDEGLGPLSINQVEVTYVNAIMPATRGGTADLTRIFRVWSGQWGSFLPREEDGGFSARFTIPDFGGKPVGRLHVTAFISPQFDPKEGGISYPISLQIFARGIPLGDGIPGALAFSDLGHEWVVRGFDAMTTPEMHLVWDKEE